MIITSIEPQKKKEERFLVFVDGKYSFALPAEALAKAGLQVGKEISQEKMTELIKEGEFSLIFEAVLNFLSFRPRSKFEIKDYLMRKNIGEETRKMVFDKLEVLRLIDDEAFTRWWIDQRSTFRPKGARLIKIELKRKGISEDLIETILVESRPQATDRILAEKLVQKKYERLKNLPDFEIKKKIYAFLSLKGFSFEVIEGVVAKVLGKR